MRSRGFRARASPTGVLIPVGRRCSVQICGPYNPPFFEIRERSVPQGLDVSSESRGSTVVSS